MVNVVKSSWFGRRVKVLLVSGESVAGELTEVSDHYIVLNTEEGELQIMVHSIMTIRAAGAETEG